MMREEGTVEPLVGLMLYPEPTCPGASDSGHFGPCSLASIVVASSSVMFNACPYSLGCAASADVLWIPMAAPYNV